MSTTENPAEPIVDAPEAEKPKAKAKPKPRETAAQKLRREQAEARKAAQETVDVPALFRKGRTISQIAADHHKTQKAVRAELDAAGVDYSADKNNGQAKPKPAPAAKKEKVPATLRGAYEGALDRKVEAGGQRMIKLLSDETTAQELKVILMELAAAADAEHQAVHAHALYRALRGVARKAG